MAAGGFLVNFPIPELIALPVVVVIAQAAGFMGFCNIMARVRAEYWFDGGSQASCGILCVAQW
jgi:hypothetical protein